MQSHQPLPFSSSGHFLDMIITVKIQCSFKRQTSPGLSDLTKGVPCGSYPYLYCFLKANKASEVPLLAVSATCREPDKINTQNVPLPTSCFQKVTSIKVLFNYYPVRNLMLSEVVTKKTVVINDVLSCVLQHIFGNDTDVFICRRLVNFALNE